jgi:hypothetical protein
VAIPTISSSPELALWYQQVKNIGKKPLSPRIPWNFTVVNKQGGNYLTWQQVDGADGYRVDISTNGDFSTGIQTVTLKGNANTAYFDTVPTSGGATPAARQYRVRATSGTASDPQTVDGLNSAVISSTAIAPSDTTTAPTTTIDSTTSQNNQARTGGGNYRVPKLPGS